MDYSVCFFVVVVVFLPCYSILVLSKLLPIIGASLSELHTSETALHDTCVCLLAAIYVNFLCK